MSFRLLWWRGKRPSVHIADVPLDPLSLPWVVDVRPSLNPAIAKGITYHAPDPERIRQELPVEPIGGNLLELEMARRAHA